jgi:hypothetical protein
VQLSYQWQDCTAPGLSQTCTNIANATARTYQVASTDVGSWLQIVEIATSTNPGGIGYSTAQTTGAAVQAVPISRNPGPAISGLAQDGQQLTASTGSWDGTQPITGYTYQWDRCTTGVPCSQILGATSNTYTLTDADVGHTLKVGVEATNLVGTGGATNCVGTPPCPVFSNPTGVVTATNTALPTINGIAQDRQTLTVSNGSWNPGGATLSHQWLACDAAGANCSAIPGATSSSYALIPFLVGKTLRVQEYATAGGATSSPVTSAATGVVQGLPSKVVTPPPPGNNGNNGGKSNKPGPSTNISSGKIRALLVGALAPQGKGARIRQLLKHGGYVFSFHAPKAGHLVISWYRLNHGKRILVAIASFTFHKSGTATIKLALTGKGRRMLRGARKMKLVSIGDFTPNGQGTTSAIKNITLKA